MGALAKVGGLYLLGMALALAAVLGVLWCFWSLWCFVLPQIYPAGPVGIIAPGYWLFVCFWILISWFGKAVFGRSSVTATATASASARSR